MRLLKNPAFELIVGFATISCTYFFVVVDGKLRKGRYWLLIDKKTSSIQVHQRALLISPVELKQLKILTLALTFPLNSSLMH